MIMIIQEVLEKTGLTTNEVKVYLTLIDLGNSLAGDISKKANLHRRPTYDSLNRLVEKGLASYTIKSGKKYFHPTDPDKILEIIKEKENEIKKILPELKEKFKRKRVEIFSEIYEGKEGLKTIMEDILKEKKEWLTIGSTGKGKFLLPFYLEHLSKRRQKLKIKRKVLIADTKEGKEYSNELKEQSLIDIKFLPKQIQNPQTIWIYGNKMVIILVSKEHPIMFMIDNKDIANSYRDYFNLLWK